MPKAIPQPEAEREHAGASQSLKKSAPKKPAPKKPAPKKPAPKKDASQKPASKKRAPKKPAPKKDASQKPASEEPASEEPASEEPASKKTKMGDPKGVPSSFNEEEKHDVISQEVSADDPPRIDLMSVEDTDMLSLVNGSPSVNDLVGDTMAGVFGLLRNAADPTRVTPSEEAFHAALEAARLNLEEMSMANDTMATILSALDLLSESRRLCEDFKSKYQTTLGDNTRLLGTIDKLKVDLQTAKEQAAASPSRAKEKASFAIPDWEMVQYVRTVMLTVALQVPRGCLVQKDNTSRFSEEELMNLWADNFEALETICLQKVLELKFTNEKWKSGITSCTSQIASCVNEQIVLWFGTLFGFMCNNKLDGKSSEEIVRMVQRAFDYDLQRHEEFGLPFRKRASDKMSLLPTEYSRGVVFATTINRSATYSEKANLALDARQYTSATGSGPAILNAANIGEHVDKLKQSVVRCFPDFDLDMVAATLANVLMAVLNAPKETKLPAIMCESGIISCKNTCETKIWYAKEADVLVEQVKDDAPEPKKVANKAATAVLLEAANKAATAVLLEAANEASGEADMQSQPFHPAHCEECGARMEEGNCPRRCEV